MQASQTRRAIDPTAIRDAWRALQAADRVPPQRDAARLLRVTEAQLVASQTGGVATRLQPRWAEIVGRLHRLGEVMVRTRNEYVVLEHEGVYRNVEVRGPLVRVIDHGIDLRLLLSSWSSGFALNEPGPQGRRRSLQFFDSAGTAVHEVFLRRGSDTEAFDRLVASLASDDQSPGLEVQPAAAVHRRPDTEIDVDSLRQRWARMRQSHELFGLLRDYEVTRLQALRLAGPTFASPVTPTSLLRVLDASAALGLSITIFAGSSGCLQIHSGPIHRVVSMRGWLNVLDPGFKLHVREDGVASAWVVSKPTADEIVTSLELFAPDGDNIAMLVADPMAGAANMRRWKNLLHQLPRL